MPVPVTCPTITKDGFTGPQDTYRWPLSLCLQEPETGSQTRIELSGPPLPDARSCPSTEKAKAKTASLQNRSKISTHFTCFTGNTFAGTRDQSLVTGRLSYLYFQTLLVPVTHHWAVWVGLLDSRTRIKVLARTIRVVMAAK
jgi:hypothetical protein